MERVPLLIIDDLGMRKLPHTAAEDLEVVEDDHTRRAAEPSEGLLV